MDRALRDGDEGPDVWELQRLLKTQGYQLELDGVFGVETYGAVRAFQAQHVDMSGEPLVVDGVVGPLTWWSLRHRPTEQPVRRFDPLKMPDPQAGGSVLGRQALAAALGEIAAGAGEVGGNNCGPFVVKYLKAVDPALQSLSEGDPWCAAFVSWCFLTARGGDRAKMPFTASAAARTLLRQFTEKGWAREPASGYQPQAGDLVFWWRVSALGWQGHVGLVHHTDHGMLYTIEGNKGPRVQGYSYVLSRMEQLLGFGSVPDSY